MGITRQQDINKTPRYGFWGHKEWPCREKESFFMLYLGKEVKKKQVTLISYKIRHGFTYLQIMYLRNEEYIVLWRERKLLKPAYRTELILVNLPDLTFLCLREQRSTVHSSVRVSWILNTSQVVHITDVWSIGIGAATGLNRGKRKIRISLGWVFQGLWHVTAYNKGFSKSISIVKKNFEQSGKLCITSLSNSTKTAIIFK